MQLQETLQDIEEIDADTAERVRNELQEELDLPEQWSIVDENVEQEDIGIDEKFTLNEDWTLFQLEDGDGNYASIILLGNSHVFQVYVEDDDTPFKSPTDSPEEIRRQLL